MIHGEVDVVAVSNTVYTFTLYDVDGNVRTLGATERLVITSLSVSTNALVFFDKNGDGTPNAGEEIHGDAGSGLPCNYSPGIAGPAGTLLKIKIFTAGQSYAEIVGRIVDQSVPL